MPPENKFCKNCAKYDNVEKKCKPRDIYTRRKNTCEEFIEK